MELDTQNPIPLHAQLHELLKKEILAGNLKDKIPSERELMDTFSVSRTTVRQAISALVRDGVLEKVHGKGTFVSHLPVEEWLGSLSSYNDIIEGLGMKPGSKLLSQGVKSSPRSIANMLGVDNFYSIERLRYADEVPIAIERQYYPLEIGFELAKYDLDKGVIYDLLELSIGVTLWEAEQTITSELPSKEDAKLLEIPEKSCIFTAERLTFDPKGNPVEYLHSINRADMYSFRIKMKRRRG